MPTTVVARTLLPYCHNGSRSLIFTKPEALHSGNCFQVLHDGVVKDVAEGVSVYSFSDSHCTLLSAAHSSSVIYRLPFLSCLRAPSKRSVSVSSFHRNYRNGCSGITMQHLDHYLFARFLTVSYVGYLNNSLCRRIQSNHFSINELSRMPNLVSSRCMTSRTETVSAYTANVHWPNDSSSVKHPSNSDSGFVEKTKVMGAGDKRSGLSESQTFLDFSTLCHVFISASIPMVGFGFMDQFVMIRAGDLIDVTLGVTFGLATLTAAAFGQLCSDTSGVLFGNTIDSFAQYLGLKPPVISPLQMATSRYRLAKTFGAAFGVAFGCLIGMAQLLFMDVDRADKRKRQKELDTIFEMVMSDGPKLFHCERATLFMYDKSKDEIWSKAVFGLDQAIRLNTAAKSLTTWVLEKKEILNVPDAYQDYRFNPVFDQLYKYKTKSVLAAPVVDESGDVVAVLMLINKLEQDGGAFTTDDERMIEMMCHHVQIFMERFAYGAAEDKRMISLDENLEILSHQSLHNPRMLDAFLPSHFSHNPQPPSAPEGTYDESEDDYDEYEEQTDRYAEFFERENSGSFNFLNKITTAFNWVGGILALPLIGLARVANPAATIDNAAPLVSSAIGGGDGALLFVSLVSANDSSSLRISSQSSTSIPTENSSQTSSLFSTVSSPSSCETQQPVSASISGAESPVSTCNVSGTIIDSSHSSARNSSTSPRNRGTSGTVTTAALSSVNRSRYAQAGFSNASSLTSTTTTPASPAVASARTSMGHRSPTNISSSNSTNSSASSDSSNNDISEWLGSVDAASVISHAHIRTPTTKTMHSPILGSGPLRSNESRNTGGTKANASSDGAFAGPYDNECMTPLKIYKDEGVGCDVTVMQDVPNSSEHRIYNFNNEDTNSVSIGLVGNVGSTDNLIGLVNEMSISGGVSRSIDSKDISLPLNSSISNAEHSGLGDRSRRSVISGVPGSFDDVVQSRLIANDPVPTGSTDDKMRRLFTDDWSHGFADDDVAQKEGAFPFSNNAGLSASEESAVPNNADVFSDNGIFKLGGLRGSSLPSSPTSSSPSSSSPPSPSGFSIRSGGTRTPPGAGKDVDLVEQPEGAGKLFGASTPTNKARKASKKDAANEPSTFRLSHANKNNRHSRPGVIPHYSDYSCSSSDDETASNYKAGSKQQRYPRPRHAGTESTHDLYSNSQAPVIGVGSSVARGTRESSVPLQYYNMSGSSSPNNRRRSRLRKWRTSSVSSNSNELLRDPLVDENKSRRRHEKLTNAINQPKTCGQKVSGRRFSRHHYLNNTGPAATQSVQTSHSHLQVGQTSSATDRTTTSDVGARSEEGYNFYNTHYPYHYDYHHALKAKIVEVNR